MKRFFFILATMFVWNVSHATLLPDDKDKDKNNEKEEEPVGEEEIMLEVLDRNPSHVFSVTPVLAKAYLQGNLVVVKLQEWAENADILLTEMTTGSVVYQMDNVSSSASIPLDKTQPGCYQIDIRIGDTWLQGFFVF